MPSFTWLRNLFGRKTKTITHGRKKPSRRTRLTLELLEDRLAPAAGALDLTFNGTGMVTTPIGIRGELAQSVAIDGNGKIVVAGYSSNGSNTDFAVVRYNADGSLDTTFSTDGKVTTDFSPGSNDLAYSVAIDGNGKIVAAGYSDNGGNTDFAVVRYNADGSLDWTFGMVTTDFGTAWDGAYDLAIDGNGKIVVAGHQGVSWFANFALARYNADGTLDTTFDTDGKVTTNFAGGQDIAFGVAIDDNGRIVAAGQGANGTNPDFGVARYNANGSLDTSFDADGRALIDFGTEDYGDDMAIDASGRIVVAGSTYPGNDADFAVARLNADGSLDTSFDTDGKAVAPFGTGGSGSDAYSMAIDGNGRIVVGGLNRLANWSDYDFALARFLPDGSLDTSFDGDGMVITDLGSNDEGILGLAIDGDGKIVAAGWTSNGTNYDFAVARYGDSQPTALAFVAQPRNVRSGNTFQVVVHALDPQSQLATGFNGPVTISIASGPVGGVLGGTLTVNAVNGVATFNGLSLNRTGNYTLRANGLNLIQNSSNIVVAAHHLVFSYVPARVYGGFYFQVVVRAVDVDGVLATNYQGPITLTGPNGSLAGRTTVNAVNGVATFRNVFFKRLGNFRLTARSGSTTEQAPTNPLGLPADSPLALTSRVIYVGFWYRPVAIR